MNDTLDEMLREHGRHWAQAQSSPPALDDAIGNATAPQGHRPWLAVAAAVVVVAGVATIPIAPSVSGSGRTQEPAAAVTSKPTVATEPAASSSAVPPDPALHELNERAVALGTETGDPNATGQAVRTTYADTEREHPDWVRTPGPAGSTSVWVIEVRAGNGTAVGVTLDADSFQTYAVFLARAPYDLSSLGDVIELPMSS